MKTIVKKTITQEIKRHDFDNEFAYLETYSNNQLKDCYFVEKDYLYPDGSIKRGGIKYFYSPFSGTEIEKEITPVNIGKFQWFDKLYYFDEEGEIFNINGSHATEISWDSCIEE